MANGKIGFFEETPGVKSATRLMCIPGFYIVLAMALVMVWNKLDPIAIGTFLGVSLAAIGITKVGGAFAEKKQDPKPAE